MSKHSPAPWIVGTDAGKYTVASLGGPNGKEIRVVAYARGLNNKTRTPEDAANAKLIAAAPDLLAACEAAMNLAALGVGAMPTPHGDRANEQRCLAEAQAIQDQLRAAIARATEVAA